MDDAEGFAVEIIFLNWAERITVSHGEVISFLKRRYGNKNREFTVLKAYGWHDYVVISKNPLPYPTTLDQQITSEGWNCVESSLLGWVLKTGGNNTGRHYWGTIKKIEGILPKIEDSSPPNDTHPALYVLSLISINREFKDNEKEELEKLEKELKRFIEWGVIIHCVGIWDIAIIVKIRRDGNPIEHIEGYKGLFLYGDYVKRSSSTILVGLTKKEFDEIKKRFKGLFKPTLEELFRVGLNERKS